MPFTLVAHLKCHTLKKCAFKLHKCKAATKIVAFSRMILIILNIKTLEFFLNHFMESVNNCNFYAISSILAHLTLYF
jgi:hypothetical protein